jgi:hypothetical protein
MPALIFHNYFARRIFEILPPVARRAAEKENKAYLLGSQGPDVLFYLRYYKPPINLLGSRIHEYGNQYSFFQRAGEYAREKNSDVLNAYLAGFICHYALDRNFHPYVFFREKDLPQYYDKEAGSYIHVYFESALDFIVLKDLMRENTKNYRSSKNIVVEKDAAKEIDAFYRAVAPMFEVELPESAVVKAIKYMRYFYRLTDDGYGVKYPFIRIVEKLAGEPAGISAFIRPKKERPAEDWLNLSEKTFPKFRNRDIMTKETFWALLKRSTDDAAQLTEDFFGGGLDKSLYNVNFLGDIV